MGEGRREERPVPRVRRRAPPRRGRARQASARRPRAPGRWRPGRGWRRARFRV